MKYCKRCDANKLESEFSLKPRMSDGLRTHCKECCIEISKIYYKTKEGLSSKQYNSQKKSSKKRRHQPPNYSLEEFREWLFSQKNFTCLYDEWVVSNYDKRKSPSADRLNDYLPYTLDNLQLITWQENNLKAARDRVSGANTKSSKSVIQLSKDNVVIATHYSERQAARATGVVQPNISACCKGTRNTAGGFSWRYA